jgi:ribosome biogenesis GTPase A
MAENAQQKNVHYFPGHMKKAQDSLADFFKAVDVVVEVADARSPLATRNPTLLSLMGKKPHLLLLSKSDKADPAVTSLWLSYFKSQGQSVSANDLKKEKLLQQLTSLCEPLVKGKRDKEARLGMKKQPLRLSIVGIPNVGKSTLINNLAGRSLVKAANTPGVTRAEQWVKLGNDYLLLDTPGILPMNYPNAGEAVRLALLGSIKEEVLPNDDLAIALLAYLKENYPACLKTRYGMADISGMDSELILASIATSRGYLSQGGAPDTSKAALGFLKDFQDGALGRLSLERPS